MVAVVLLDSNFLFVPLQFKVDVFEVIPRLLEESTDLVLLSGVKEEIIEKNKRSIGKLVSKQGLGALQLVSKKVSLGQVKLVQVDRRQGEAVDDYIIRAGKDIIARASTIDDKPLSRLLVATNDKGLKMKCRAAKIGVVQLRQRSHVELLL
jgi:rRNA-processing protein FCF1